MNDVEVTFTPTKEMPEYRGTCMVVDPSTGDRHKPLLVIKKAGTYKLPRDKAAQVCTDFPSVFSCKEELDWTDKSLGGGYVELEPGEGIPGTTPKKGKGAPAPAGNK